jgi:5,10-methenyltetrahydrofolate synthetase
VVEALLHWPPLANADRTLIFMPIAREIDLTPLQKSGLRCEFLTTRTPDSGGDLTIHSLGGPMQVHRYGFLQPHPSSPEHGVDDVSVFLLPGLAFDVLGNRLGRGAGYYDRLLQGARRGAFTVGVTSVELVVDQLPTEAHDQKVRFLATEEGVIETAHG